MDRLDAARHRVRRAGGLGRLCRSQKHGRCISDRPSRRHPAPATSASCGSSTPSDGRSDLGWIARHLTRTKLGLALGAGGAKGFAHVGVLDVLQRAGYVVDFVAGSSIGGLIGGLMGLEMDADAIDRQLKRVWSPEHVDLLADLSPEGISIGLERASCDDQGHLRRPHDVRVVACLYEFWPPILKKESPFCSTTGRFAKPCGQDCPSLAWRCHTGSGAAAPGRRRMPDAGSRELRPRHGGGHRRGGEPAEPTGVERLAQRGSPDARLPEEGSPRSRTQ